MYEQSYILPLVGIFALLVGPLVYAMARQTRWALDGIDGFVLTSVGGLVVLFVLPPAMAATGGWAVIAMLAGMTLPIVMERMLGIASRTAHTIVLVSALVGLVLHTMLDGAALFEGGRSAESMALAIAVILHQIPVSIAIWNIVRPRYGKRGASFVLFLVALGTLAGAGLGHELHDFGTGASFQLFQALVAGSLLHVVVHRHAEHGGSKLPEVVGGLLGVVLLLIVPNLVSHGHDHGESSILGRLLDISLETAPALLLGFFLASLLGSRFRRPPTRWLSRGGVFSQSLRGVAVGLPLPICSCGVVPLYHGLIRAGVPASAALAFLVATPEIGIESLILSVPLLGVEITTWRLLTAAIIALITGVVIGRLVPASAVPDDDETSGESASLAAFWRSLRAIVDDTAPWLMAGLILAAIVDPQVVQGLIGLPEPVEVLFFALAGIPIYVCASGATPLGAAFIWAGVSPGAALAFLMAGPTTNVTTFATLTQLHGRRIAIGFAAVVLSLSVASGILLNTFSIGLDGTAMAPSHDHAWWAWASLAVMGLVFLESFVRKGPQDWVSSVLNFGHEDHDHDHDGHDHGGHDHDGHDHGGHDHQHGGHDGDVETSAKPRFKVVSTKDKCGDCGCDH